MKKESLDDELKYLSPFLQQQKQRGNGFQVPDQYFEQLESVVFNKIDAMGARRTTDVLPAASGWSVRLFRPRALMAAAAVLVALLAAVWLFRPLPTNEQLAPYAEVEPSEEELENYVVDNLHEFEYQQLASIPNDMADAEEEIGVPANKAKTPKPEFRPEDVESLLDDMSDEELEDLL